MAYRKLKFSFARKNIAKKGFIRDFKVRLLGEGCSLNKPEFEAVIEAFRGLYFLKTGKEESELIKQPGFSKWWLGKRLPDDDHRDKIKLVFPDLFEKWFGLERYTNRLQLHLASLDLFSMANECSCNDKKVKTYCEKCLLIAKQEAKLILDNIHEDWRPTKTGYSDIVDLCISGPKERSGLNVEEVRFYKNTACKPGYHVPRKEDYREKINYNLDLTDTSFIGLQIPEEILSVYQDGNPLSVCSFLFLLIGLNLKCDVKYRDDLILDFFTALNCASIVLFHRHYGFIGHDTDTDSVDKRVQSLFLSFQEYLFNPDEKNMESKTNKVGKNATEKNNSETEPRLEVDTVYFQRKNYCDQLSDEFLLLLSEVLGLNKDDLCKDLGRSDSYESFFLNIYEEITDSKHRYFEIFKITGLQKEEIQKEFKSMVQNPFNITYEPNSKNWQKPSPYNVEPETKIVY